MKKINWDLVFGVTYFVIGFIMGILNIVFPNTPQSLFMAVSTTFIGVIYMRKANHDRK